MTLSPMRRRVVQAVLRIYPRWWRERYAEELLDLVDSAGISRRHVVGMAIEGWQQRLTGPASFDPSFAGTCRRLARATAIAWCIQLVVSVAMEIVSMAGFMAVTISSGLPLDWFHLDWHLKMLGRSWLVLPAVSAFFSWGLALASPMILMLLVTRAGLRWPRVARLTTMAAFLSFPFWLLSVPMIVPALAAGWCFACVLFPSSAAAEPTVTEPIAEGANS